EGEVVGVTGGGSVAHLHELLVAALNVAVARLDGVLDSTGNGVVDAQDGALDELDLSGVETLQAAARRRLSRHPLALHPAVLILVVQGGHGARSVEAPVGIEAILAVAGIVKASALRWQLCGAR